MEQLTQWLAAQQTTLDKIVADAGERYFEERKHNPNFIHDLQTCSREMWALSGTGDLCYDRPGIGFCYGLWYHANRVSALLGTFQELLLKTPIDDKIDIYDLGAGTGAIQWAIGLLYIGCKEVGQPIAPIRIVNIDSSPFMLEYSQKYLWERFQNKYPAAKEIAVEYCINNWTNHINPYQANNWLCASYVFDHSENKETLSEEFGKLVGRVKPSNVLLFTSSQTAQLTHVNAVVGRVVAEGYREIVVTPRKFYYNGTVSEVLRFRNEIQAKESLGFIGTPTWDKSYFHSRLLRKTQSTLPLTVENIKIYHSPEIVRAKVRLTDQQEAASMHVEQPTLIIGPAGCGKSVVLTERIKKIVERKERPYDPTLSILLTTFNKKLVKVLGDWLEELLDPKQAQRIPYQRISQWGKAKNLDHCIFKFKGSTQPNIQILHFDVLPTIIGGVKGLEIMADNLDYETFHRKLFKEAAESYLKSKGLSKDEHAKIIDPDFLIDEFERIIYGVQVKTKAEYLNLERVGRGSTPKLNRNSERREIIYAIMLEYLKKLKDRKLENFHLRRNRFIKNISAGKVKKQFTHVFIDELQDCTAADHFIFQSLLLTPNNLVLAGDLAQSIQLGAAFHVPKGDDMKRFKKVKLDGSFRLPFRISESIRELSVKISKRYGAREGVEADIIIPYRGAQPGARPIIVYGSSADSMAEKISQIVKAYHLYGITNASIFERDHELHALLSSRGIPSACDIILKSKGLEYSCVVWSSRLLADTKLEQEEFAYTIFTRTSSVLIVAVFDNIDPRLKDIVKMFDLNKSIYWDVETLEHMTTIGADVDFVEEDDMDLSRELSIESVESENLDDFIS